MSPGNSGPSPRTELPTQFSQLRLTLEAPARARSGEPVPLVFTVTNAGKSPVTLYLMGREPSADFQVSDAAGRRVWSLLRGETTMAALRLFPLDPGKGLSFRHAWNQRSDAGLQVASGVYLVCAVLLTDDPSGLASPPARLRIER